MLETAIWPRQVYDVPLQINLLIHPYLLRPPYLLRSTTKYVRSSKYEWTEPEYLSAVVC